MSKNQTQLQSSQLTQNISIPSNWSLPRFSFGELVKWKWNFNGLTYEYQGVVVGLYYSSDPILGEVGWEYSIQLIYNFNRLNHPIVSDIETLHESLLEAC
ncbi:MAG: hypothetical protein DSM106950_04080 [Stigonema ocellatum SAG 48.90 = DSM 106950]|nr:hypothetical protein [Stigonema ocellatum SAG 48.90 = DSM 106950]